VLEEPSEDDPEVSARIKMIEKGKKGFSKEELAKVKFFDNLEQI
jgi:hypothetical protein